jgi:hypothetical protein
MKVDHIRFMELTDPVLGLGDSHEGRVEVESMDLETMVGSE